MPADSSDSDALYQGPTLVGPQKMKETGLKSLRENLIYESGYLWFPHEGRVPHISLVFREMWDTTNVDR